MLSVRLSLCSYRSLVFIYFRRAMATFDGVYLHSLKLGRQTTRHDMRKP